MGSNSEIVQKRLSFKTRALITIVVAMAIVTGTLLYLLPFLYGESATLLTILLMNIAVGLPTVYFLKTPRLFAMNIFAATLSPLILGVFNIVSPKYSFVPSTSSYLVGEAASLFAISFFDWFILFALYRLLSGYEMLYEPVMYSYILDHEFNKDSSKNFEILFRLLGATSISRLSGKEFSIIQFDYGGDKYLAFFGPRDNLRTELNFLVFRMSRDTIIQPDQKRTEFFFSLFDAGTQKWKEQEALAEVQREQSPQFLKSTQNALISMYGSPVLPIRLPIARPSFSKIKTWSERHSVLIGFVAGIVATIISSLILRYIFGI